MRKETSMNSYFSKLALAALFLSLMAAPAHAIMTPQKYCESLAATSCEILNIEPGGGTMATDIVYGSALIKYCRNRVLSFWLMHTQTQTNSYNFKLNFQMAFGGKAGDYTSFRDYILIMSSDDSYIITIDGTQPTNTSLCAVLP